MAEPSEMQLLLSKWFLCHLRWLVLAVIMKLHVCFLAMLLLNNHKSVYTTHASAIVLSLDMDVSLSVCVQQIKCKYGNNSRCME